MRQGGRLTSQERRREKEGCIIEGGGILLTQFSERGGKEKRESLGGYHMSRVIATILKGKETLSAWGRGEEKLSSCSPV